MTLACLQTDTNKGRITWKYSVYQKKKKHYTADLAVYHNWQLEQHSTSSEKNELYVSGR